MRFFSFGDIAAAAAAALTYYAISGSFERELVSLPAGPFAAAAALAVFCGVKAAIAILRSSGNGPEKPTTAL